MYFQYSGDELIGFCLNDVQYFYIKNTSGDIVGITDYDGNLIAEYEYDEWGKLLNITTAEEGNEEQLKIATANPFRYRGYYYDAETGYYYLQSRYYNPEWGRFISADDLNCLKNNNSLTANAYIYCINNPIIYSDSTGYDFTWETLLTIIRNAIIIDFVFPQFRYTPKANTSHKLSNYVSEAGKAIAVVITEIFTFLDLQEISKRLGKLFNFDGFQDYLQKKVDLYREAFDKGIIKFWTSVNGVASSSASWISNLSGLFDKLLPKNILKGISSLPYITNFINDLSGRYISPIGTYIMALYDLLTNGIIDTASAIISTFATPFGGILSSLLFDNFLDKLGSRNKAEYLAYNWYYLIFVNELTGVI